MRRPGLAVPDLYGQCAVCFQDVPATPAAAPYEGKARLAVHDHPRAELGRCIGSRMVTRAAGQLVLFPVAEIQRGSSVSPLERLEAAIRAWQAAPYGGVVEYDAANEMAAAGLAVLAVAAPELKEAA